MTDIESVDAWEVLDSRGDPTVRVRAVADGATGTFTVPAGASTGSHEAVERRDGGDRYGGKGVREAVAAVREELAPVAVGRDATDQRGLDAALVAADGTDRLERLGANAVLGVSGAVAHAAAAATGRPLYAHLAGLADRDAGRLPNPMVNAISGGRHAPGDLVVQDLLVVPAGAETYPEALETAWAVRTALADRLGDDHPPLVADEGGFAPPIDRVEDGLDLLVAAVRDAGHAPARDDVAVAVDVAATEFHDPGTGRYALDDRTLDAEGMVETVASWVEEYPVVSVEDPLAENDWAAWADFVARADGVHVVGDDLLATDADRLDRAAETGAANAVLVKPNQAGTLTRAMDVIERAQRRGIATVVSARSGETCDATVADLAVALDAERIKIGSLARSERLAKYNRLLGIDREHDGGFAADAYR